MVAVKVIRAHLAEDAVFRARFAREVAAARKVGGLFTTQVVDADLDGPVPWLVTAYVPGTALSDAVEQQGPLPPQSVLALAAALAEGLSAIHAAGVIHRDLKPSNVLLAPDGPRIIDFGISSAAGATSLTGNGDMIGSPGFMSPEQAEGLTVGPASDIFSLAGVLIYAASGDGPFGTGDTTALLYRVVHGKPNIDQVPDVLRPLIGRSLSRDAKRRPTATEFLTELTAACPSAANLTDWLPPGVLGLSGPRTASAATSANQPAWPTKAGTSGPALVAGAAESAGVMAAADTAEAMISSNLMIGPPTHTSMAPQDRSDQHTHSDQQGPGQQGYSGFQGHSGAQQNPAPQGYPGGQWWAARPPGGSSADMPQTPLNAQAGPGAPGTDQWYSLLLRPGPGRKRPRWLLPAGGVVVLVVVVALVFALGGSFRKALPARPGLASPGSSRSTSPSPDAKPAVGDLQLAQFQVGDCLTGSNMDLNTSAPWPKLTLAVPCSQPHTAQVFYANSSFWAKNGAYPGNSTVSKEASAQCNAAFASYDGIAYSKSKYTWTNIVPDSTTWPNGDRALHCVAYYATSRQPAGAPITGSIEGTRQ